MTEINPDHELYKPEPPPNLLERRPSQGLVRASFAQQRLWFFDQMVPNSSVYNISLRIEIMGDLIVDTLTKSLEHIIERHETLRTSFESIDGEPWQTVDPYIVFSIPVHDIDGDSEADVMTAANRFARREANTPFDLGKAPLIRACILRLPELRFHLLVTMHHIVSDGTSIDLFLTELRSLYQGALDGHCKSLPELPIQYVDYSEWQRLWLTGERFHSNLKFWLERLKDLPALELPTEGTRPRIQSHMGERLLFDIPSDLITMLRDIGRNEGATLFMGLLAAFNILLARYAGQTDVAVGVPIAGRNHPALEKMIGFFVNTLVLRIDLSGDPTFRDLLQRVRDRCIEAYEHQDLPFERLVEELKPQRDLSRSPLFQVAFQYFEKRPPTHGWKVLPSPHDEVATPFEVAKFDQEWVLWTSGGKVSGRVDFCAALFDRKFVRRLLDNFQVVLRRVAAEPDRRISAINVMADQEWTMVSTQFSRGAAQPVPKQTVYERFCSQAAQRPDATCIVSDVEYSYADVLSQARRIASFLEHHGCSTSSIVAVHVARCAEVLPLLLAINSLGATYLLIDRDLPISRKLTMLNIAGAAHVVHDTEDTPVFDDLTVTLHDFSECLSWQEVHTESDAWVSQNSTAYLIFTSGSTGTPKAVAVDNSALTNYVITMAATVDVGAGDTFLAITSFSFDIFITELLLPVMAGATVILCSRSDVLDATVLAQMTSRYTPTHMQATPTTYRMLVNSGWTGLHNGVLLCGGETLSESLAEALLERCRTLWNCYGPTETTVWSTACRISTSSDITIGRPLPNQTCYLLAKDTRTLVPLGAIGEIAIGGAGVALGYHGRPDLTAAKFVKSPFAPNERLYLTGDLGRYRSDGCIEFFGRADSQIKLRGHRIELGEVEACLLRHNGVSQAAASVRDDLSGEPQLVLYYTPFEGGSVSSRALREFTETQLPGYMIPSAYVCIAEGLPRSSNGKVDRKALTMLKTQTGVRSFVVAGPRNPHERVIAGIWATVLGPQEFNIDDNFFDLGGHSLKLARVLALLRPHANGPLSIIDLFQHTSIRTLAKFALGAEDGSNRIEITSRTPVYRRFRRTDS